MTVPKERSLHEGRESDLGTRGYVKREMGLKGVKNKNKDVVTGNKGLDQVPSKFQSMAGQLLTYNFENVGLSLGKLFFYLGSRALLPLLLLIKNNLKMCPSSKWERLRRVLSYKNKTEQRGKK